MCGIVALFAVGDKRITDRDGKLESQLDDALERIKHRGPDGRGVWIDTKGRCALAHCRLSILDPSPLGSQPLHYPSINSYLHCMVNGELYSHPSMRDSLSANYTFQSGSDSELALALYRQYGLEFLNHLRGEFTVVLYDELEDLWIVARDRYGIKPLYWRRDEGGGRIEVCSEMKGFLGLGWKPTWNIKGLVEMSWDQDQGTIFKGVQKGSHNMDTALCYIAVTSPSSIAKQASSYNWIHKILEFGVFQKPLPTSYVRKLYDPEPAVEYRSRSEGTSVNRMCDESV